MTVSKRYIGVKPQQPGPGVVWVESFPSRGRLALRHHVHHSPDGFNWGYGGSGAVELGRCLLWDFLGEEPSAQMYKAFTHTVIAKLPDDGWMLTSDFLREWVAKYRHTEDALDQMLPKERRHE